MSKVHWKGVHPCPALADLVGPVQNYSTNLFPHHTLFPFICPLAQQAGQAAVPGRLSLNMCLWLCALEYKYACSTLKAIGILENRNDFKKDQEYCEDGKSIPDIC